MLDIIAVDDELTITRFLDSFFKLNEFKAKTFNCPEKAFKFLQTNQVKILMTDINMPEMSGIVFAGKVRQIKPDVSLLAFTGSIDACSEELAVFDRVIEKPCSIDLLNQTISEYLAKHAAAGKYAGAHIEK
ncbi:MAG: response regulator [Planctomycetota bacterium]|jgi:two-component SAPR family response regulator